MFPYDILAIAVVVALLAIAIGVWLFSSGHAARDFSTWFGLSAVRPETAAVYSIVLGPPRRIRLGHRPPPPAEGPRIRRGLPLSILATPQPLWREKGWRQVEGRNAYRGSYRAAGRAFRGEIAQPYAGHFDACIWHPPLAEISRNTHHGPCFNRVGQDGRHTVHFSLEPVSLDHAITSIEVVLEEALTGRTH